MKPKYVVHYTIFGKCYNGFHSYSGFKSYYKFFEDKDSMDKFFFNSNIHKENCIIFKNIDEV